MPENLKDYCFLTLSVKDSFSLQLRVYVKRFDSKFESKVFPFKREKPYIICSNVENNNRLALNWDQISLLDKTNLGLGCLVTKESMTEASEILSGRLVGRVVKDSYFQHCLSNQSATFWHQNLFIKLDFNYC